MQPEDKMEDKQNEILAL